ncbi:hypothetical protein B0T14DRAFT_571277 [Immersiella caudata]|uniref:Uncharacterized protein n=1 Tax=Immersiella caudata TaxID=314043 RepID=A0AA39W4E3_9PEZI|nr:hypothetical protein B0T14DRAFT_571277 [Immersiella caudata]
MPAQPDTAQLNNLAQQAARNLDSYESKMGNNPDAKTSKPNGTVEQGQRAENANLRKEESDTGVIPSQVEGGKERVFKGADYELAGSVPDQSADMGNVEVASAVGRRMRMQGENV